jgi:hypothetical protein
LKTRWNWSISQSRPSQSQRHHRNVFLGRVWLIRLAFLAPDIVGPIVEGRHAGRTQLRSPDQVGDGILGGVGRCSSQTREVCTARAREQFGNESVARLMRKCKRTGGQRRSRLAWSGNQKAVSDRHASDSLRLTRLHSSVEANRHSRSAALVLHLLFAER